MDRPPRQSTPTPWGNPQEVPVERGAVDTQQRLATATFPSLLPQPGCLGRIARKSGPGEVAGWPIGSQRDSEHLWIIGSETRPAPSPVCRRGRCLRRFVASQRWSGNPLETMDNGLCEIRPVEYNIAVQRRIGLGAICDTVVFCAPLAIPILLPILPYRNRSASRDALRTVVTPQVIIMPTRFGPFFVRFSAVYVIAVIAFAAFYGFADGMPREVAVPAELIS